MSAYPSNPLCWHRNHDTMLARVLSRVDLVSRRIPRFCSMLGVLGPSTLWWVLYGWVGWMDGEQRPCSGTHYCASIMTFFMTEPPYLHTYIDGRPAKLGVNPARSIITGGVCRHHTCETSGQCFVCSSNIFIFSVSSVDCDLSSVVRWLLT
ncbi:hypothetical protein F4777DRAFT_241302 [Nemania sp. FL0916]|nr:hypothetical protein F4777DRAFT_241302 [Nemania sp. FL0916]